jgi:hypothetical protein
MSGPDISFSLSRDVHPIRMEISSGATVYDIRLSRDDAGVMLMRLENIVAEADRKERERQGQIAACAAAPSPAATYEQLQYAITNAIGTAIDEGAPREFVEGLNAVGMLVAARVNRP